MHYGPPFRRECWETRRRRARSRSRVFLQVGPGFEVLTCEAAGAWPSLRGSRTTSAVCEECGRHGVSPEWGEVTPPQRPYRAYRPGPPGPLSTDSFWCFRALRRTNFLIRGRSNDGKQNRPRSVARGCPYPPGGAGRVDRGVSVAVRSRCARRADPGRVGAVLCCGGADRDEKRSRVLVGPGGGQGGGCVGDQRSSSSSPLVP